MSISGAVDELAAGEQGVTAMTRMTRMMGVTEPEKKARKSHQPASDKHQRAGG